MPKKVHNYMEMIKKPVNKFAAGKPRYCQKCGKESLKLFQVTKEAKTVNQLYYCKDCKDKFEKTPKP